MYTGTQDYLQRHSPTWNFIQQVRQVEDSFISILRLPSGTGNHCINYWEGIWMQPVIPLLFSMPRTLPLQFHYGPTSVHGTFTSTWMFFILFHTLNAESHHRFMSLSQLQFHIGGWICCRWTKTSYEHMNSSMVENTWNQLFSRLPMVNTMPRY